MSGLKGGLIGFKSLSIKDSIEKIREYKREKEIKIMLFWLFIILIVVGILIRNISFDFECFGEILAELSGVAVFISLILIICDYATTDSNLEANREIYKALTYKIESNTCRDEFGLLNKEVIDEIQEWNKDVRYYQKIQDNFWVGIFYPNVFDEFEIIDYEIYNRGK